VANHKLKLIISIVKGSADNLKVQIKFYHAHVRMDWVSLADLYSDDVTKCSEHSSRICSGTCSGSHMGHACVCHDMTVFREKLYVPYEGASDVSTPAGHNGQAQG